MGSLNGTTLTAVIGSLSGVVMKNSLRVRGNCDRDYLFRDLNEKGVCFSCISDGVLA